MLELAPYHAKTLTLSLRTPGRAIFILDELRKEDPTEDRLSAGGTDARLLQSLLFTRRYGLGRLPFRVVGSTKILGRQKNFRGEGRAGDCFTACVLALQRKGLRMLPEISSGEGERAGARGGGIDGINRHHASLHVILHMAMKHPCAGIVREHVHGLHASGKKFNHISISSSVGDGFAVPVRSVQVDLISH